MSLLFLCNNFIIIVIFLIIAVVCVFILSSLDFVRYCCLNSNTYKNGKIDNDCPGYCGYLASMASMAGGADAGYIFEEKFGITELKRDLDSMVSKMDKKMVYR